jgi:hypothetical protein
VLNQGVFVMFSPTRDDLIFVVFFIIKCISNYFEITNVLMSSS